MQVWRYSAASDVGLQRNNNEDSYLSCPELGLWVIADGMGGHASGEIASAIVSETIKTKVSDGDDLADAIQSSHQAILKAAANGHGGQGMGSTVVALQAINDHYSIAWVGDSRAYLWSPLSATPLARITTDHSYVQMLYQTGVISEDELDSHPEKNIITQCLGSIELDTVSVDAIEGEWHRNEWILLCSDGLTDAVPDEVIADILSNTASIQTATRDLINSALSFGGKDNITVAVVESPASRRNIFHSMTSSLTKLFKP